MNARDDDHRVCPAKLESLEPRRLLAAEIVRGVLDVEGTRRADSIVITRDGRRAVRVEVNGVAESFSFRAFPRIRNPAGAGHDYVAIGNRHVVSSAATLRGGDGNDSLSSGAGNDSVDAGDGNDYVFTSGGGDTVWGGAGNDTLQGWEGDDSLSGDNGADVVEAGDGDDTVPGGRGDDRLRDGPGRDRVYGNAGGDHFFQPIDHADESQFRDRAPGEPLSPDHYDLTVVGGDATLDGAWGDFDYNGHASFEDLLLLAKQYDTSHS
jgi:hypothetical protein